MNAVFKKLIVIQIISVLIFIFLGLVMKTPFDTNAAAGGAFIALCASFVQQRIVFRFSTSDNPKNFVTVMTYAQIMKFIIVGVGFTLAFRQFQIEPLGSIIGFMSALTAYFFLWFKD